MNRLFKNITLICSTLLLVGCSNDTSNKPNTITLESISLSGEFQTTFTVDDAFNHDGLVVTAFYSDQNKKDVTSLSSVSTPDMSSDGVKEVIVTYQDKTAQYSITVNKKDSGQITLDSIALSGTYQTEFTEGNTFTYEGLVVTAKYSNGDEVTVTPTSVSTPDMNVLGDQTITVTYLTVSASYTITVTAKEVPPEDDDFKGYITLPYTRLDVKKDSKTQYQLAPTPVGFEPEGNFPYSFSVDKEGYVEVSKYGTLKSANNKLGSCVVTCTCTDPNYAGITAKCVVNVLEELPVKQKAWKQVLDYTQLKNNDVIVLASPTNGVTASLDNTNAKLQKVNSTFSSDLKTITSLGEGTAEFVVGFETKDGEQYVTLENQNGEYLIGTHQGKVKYDSSNKTNKYWDIHVNMDPDTMEEWPLDGAVIENYVDSLGYLMYNCSLNYFTTYVDNSLRPGVMELPFVYRLEEI